jgi:hypothetical protein
MRPLSSGMETTRSSETVVSHHITTQWHNPEDHKTNLQCRENLESRIRMTEKYARRISGTDRRKNCRLDDLNFIDPSLQRHLALGGFVAAGPPASILYWKTAEKPGYLTTLFHLQGLHGNEWGEEVIMIHSGIRLQRVRWR